MNTSGNGAEPSLCARGCGFYGTPRNNGMCSKCYNNFLKQEALRHLSKLALEPDTEQLPDCPSTGRGKEEVTAAGPSVKNRCKSCNRKLGLLGFECRCGHAFCSLHRLPEAHSCRSDYRTAAREALVKANPVVKPDKNLNRM